MNIKKYNNNNKCFKLWNFISYLNIFTVINDFAKCKEYNNNVKFLIQECTMFWIQNCYNHYTFISKKEEKKKKNIRKISITFDNNCSFNQNLFLSSKHYLNF